MLVSPLGGRLLLACYTVIGSWRAQWILNLKVQLSLEQALYTLVMDIGLSQHS